MHAITVFLAVRSPLWRAYVLASLRRAGGIVVVGEAADAPRALEEVIALQPQVLLGDEEILADLMRAPLPSSLTSMRIVLVTPAPRAGTGHLGRKVTGTLLLSAAPEQVADSLRAIVAQPVAASPPPLARDVRERFRFTGPMSGSDADRAPPRVTAPVQPSERRAVSPALEHLLGATLAVQRDTRRYPRDVTSGLARVAALEHTLRLVAETGYPTAIVVSEVQTAHGAATSSLDDVLLRRMSASLRANVRRGDLICRAGPALFVLLVPGLSHDAAPLRVQQIRETLLEACGPSLHASGHRMSMEVGVWETGLEPVALLTNCVLALRGAQA
jgi:DNA-binding NarL/FixJ family response regulator